VTVAVTASDTTANTTANTAANAASDTTADSATDAASNTSSDASSDATSDASSDSGSTAESTASSDDFLLGLVPDEVYFGLAGLCGRDSGDVDFGSFFGPLDQDVNEGLLGVLRDGGNDGDSGCGWRGGLDEDDLIVLLGWRGLGDDLLGRSLIGLWGRDVNVDVLLDGGYSAS
jgi:hypothetical protein